MSFEDLLQSAAMDAPKERNRLREEKSPLPGSAVQEIGMLVISAEIDDRITDLSKRLGIPVGEVLSRALSVYEKSVSRPSEPYELT